MLNIILLLNFLLLVSSNNSYDFNAFLNILATKRLLETSYIYSSFSFSDYSSTPFYYSQIQYSSSAVSYSYIPVSKPTIKPTITISKVPSIAPSPKVTVLPTSVPSPKVTVLPTIPPTPKVTLTPVSKPTLAPFTVTLMPTAGNTLSFESILTLNGLQEAEPSGAFKEALIIATAISMNTSATNVIYKDTEIIRSYRRQLLSYDIKSVLETTVTLSPSVAPLELYAQMTASLVSAVGNGNFNLYLKSASIALNYTLGNLTVNGVTNEAPIINIALGTSAPSGAPTSAPNGSKVDDAVIASVIIIVTFALFIFVMYVKHIGDMKKKEVQLIELTSITPVTTAEATVVSE